MSPSISLEFQVRTEVLSTTTPELRARAIEIAVNALRKGDVVALPTETVYGLAADALNSNAVVKIFEAKSRPRFDPLIVHLPNLEWLERIVRIDHRIKTTVERLSAKFWPGPLTIVLPRHEIVPDIVTAGLETVAVRLSAHSLFLEMIQRFGSPLAAPSANRFGCVSPTMAQHVLNELDGHIPLIVDSGLTTHGIESTVIALRNDRIELLRPGPITSEQLNDFGLVVPVQPSAQPEAPGQLSSHYAPATPLSLVDDASAFPIPAGKRCGLLAWETQPGAGEFCEVRQLSPEGNLREAAQNLFRYLRELDQLRLDLIVAERLPNEGIAVAINDRLSRAAR